MTLGFSLPAIGFLGFAVVAHYVPHAWERRVVDSFSALSPLYQSAAVLTVAYAVLQMASLAKRSFVYFQF